MCKIGFGTWKIPDNETGMKIIQNALMTGYRHFDSAERYANEKMLGASLNQSDVSREDIWLTGKVWKTNMGYSRTLASCENSLKKMNMEYFDCYLIHWPTPVAGYSKDNAQEDRETWKAMERLKEQGIVRSIGTANFMKHHLEALSVTANIPPAVNQIEIHPGCPQKETVTYCKENQILLEAWSPLGSGSLLSMPMLQEIAASHSATVAEICLNWLLDQKIIPIAGSKDKQRMWDNFHLKRLKLTEKEKIQIAQLPITGDPHGINPDSFFG